MFQKYLLAAKNCFFKKARPNKSDIQQDCIEVGLPGLKINLRRNIKLDTPHEVTVVLPRVEMRKRCLNPDCSQYEYEIIYSSITVVHAPRHPLAAPEPGSSPEKP